MSGYLDHMGEYCEYGEELQEFDYRNDPKVRAIRKELAILIKERTKDLPTQKEKNKAVNDCRQEINLKYGKGWREPY